MIGYGHQYIDESDIKAVVDVLKSDYLTQGPSVAKFEQEICRITGAKYCVSVSNATAGLHIAVAALELGDDVEGITTPNTFLASSNCMVYNNIKLYLYICCIQRIIKATLKRKIVFFK